MESAQLRDRGTRHDDTDAKLGWLLVVGTIPAGILGPAARARAAQHLRLPAVGRVLPVAERFLLYGADRCAGERRPGLGRRMPNRAAEQLGRRRGRRGAGSGADSRLLPLRRDDGRRSALGLSNKDAARFAFLLATPIIGAAAVLKLPEAVGPERRRRAGPGSWHASLAARDGIYDRASAHLHPASFYYRTCSCHIVIYVSGARDDVDIFIWFPNSSGISVVSSPGGRARSPSTCSWSEAGPRGSPPRSRPSARARGSASRRRARSRRATRRRRRAGSRRRSAPTTRPSSTPRTSGRARTRRRTCGSSRCSPATRRARSTGSRSSASRSPRERRLPPRPLRRRDAEAPAPGRRPHRPRDHEGAARGGRGRRRHRACRTRRSPALEPARTAGARAVGEHEVDAATVVLAAGGRCYGWPRSAASSRRTIPNATGEVTQIALGARRRGARPRRAPVPPERRRVAGEHAGLLDSRDDARVRRRAPQRRRRGVHRLARAA